MVTKAAQDVQVVTVSPAVAAGGLPAMEAALTSVRLGVHKVGRCRLVLLPSL